MGAIFPVCVRAPGPRAGPSAPGSKDMARPERAEFRLMEPSGNKAKKEAKQAKGPSSSANMPYHTRLVNRNQRTCLLEIYSNEMGRILRLSFEQTAAGIGYTFGNFVRFERP